MVEEGEIDARTVSESLQHIANVQDKGSLLGFGMHELS